jgi:hypothetical protein
MSNYDYNLKVESDYIEKRTITKFNYAGLELFKGVYDPGYWYVLKYKDRIQYKDLNSIHIIISGFGIADSDGSIDLPEGWMSITDSNYVGPGSYKRNFPKGCVMWCIRRPLPPPLPEGIKEAMVGPLIGLETSIDTLSLEGVQVLRLQANETAEIPAKDNLFVLSGNCRTGTKQLTVEKYYVIGDQSKTLVAESKTYLVHWSNLV